MFGIQDEKNNSDDEWGESRDNTDGELDQLETNEESSEWKCNICNSVNSKEDWNCTWCSEPNWEGQIGSRNIGKQSI